MRISIPNKPAIRNPQSVVWVCPIVLSLAQTLPPLARVALDSYPPPTREALSRVYREATARPADAGTVGALARALHAWDQWGVAHDAYLRAHALAPRTFEWLYLDAVVLQRLARHA